MANKNNYWVERDVEALNRLTDKSVAATEKQLAKYYSSCQRRIINGFESLYNELLSQFKAGIEPTPADLYRLDRYWELQAQLQHELTLLGDKSNALLSRRFIEQYKDVYKNIAIPSENAFATIDNETAAQMIKRIWCADGKEWSQRIWQNTANLQSSLNEQLIHSVITGEKTSALKKSLINDFQVSYSQADRVVRTEMSHIQNTAALERYKDAGIEEYEILADGSCDDCKEYDGKRFSISEPSPVPFHPNCRCCIIPVIKYIKGGSNNDNN